MFQAVDVIRCPLWSRGLVDVYMIQLTPPMFIDSANLVAVAALPVNEPELPEALPVNGPVNPVAVSIPLLELKVRLSPDFGARLPVGPVANKGKHVVSEDSSATVIVVAIEAVPVTAPVLSLRHI